MHRSFFKIFFTLASLFLLFISTQHGFAQRGRQTPEERAQRLKEQLSLTDSQTVLVTAIYKQSQQDMSAKMDSLKSDDPQARRQLMRETMDKSDADVQKILTDDQKKKFDELKKQRQQMFQRRNRSDSDQKSGL